MTKKKVIGITDCSKYPNYEKWILAEPDVEVIHLGYAQNNFEEIKKCNAIVLTGGEDIHPRFYDKLEYLPQCDRANMDERRDEFEWKVLEFTERNKVPLLGICRGLQMANVFFGGTLVPDIVSTGKPDHSKTQGIDKVHLISINHDTMLREITGSLAGTVNSAHHQSADVIGKGLRVNATSHDGTVEGLERKDPSVGPFLLLVQWHPERMSDQNSPLVRNIKERFLKSINRA